MLAKLNIFEIRRDALSVLKNKRTFSFTLLYYLTPLLIAVLLYKIDFQLSDNMASAVISGISLFSGFMFSLLFIITSNYSNRKNKLDISQEENLRYLNHYKSFSNNLISLISYSIIKALIVIALIIVLNSSSDFLNSYKEFASKVVLGVLFIIIFQYFLMVIWILKNMYSMLFEDINR